jgi:hypothetical protein
MVLSEPMEFRLHLDQRGCTRRETEHPLVTDGRQLVVASEQEDRQRQFAKAPFRLAFRFPDGPEERPIMGTEEGKVRFQLDAWGREDPRLAIGQLDFPALVQVATARHGFVHQSKPPY